MWIKILAGMMGIIILGLVGNVLVSRNHLNEKVNRDVKGVLEGAKTQNRVFKKEDLEGLPEPVKGYLNRVLEEGQPYVDTVRLKQKRRFRVGEDNRSPWKPFETTQHYSIHPPGFIWEAKIKFFPLLPVRVVDMYKDGEGSLQAKLLSTIAVGEAKSSPEMNSGELLRYLSEAVWFPTAFLPDQGVEWKSVDDNIARATIEDQGLGLIQI